MKLISSFANSTVADYTHTTVIFFLISHGLKFIWDFFQIIGRAVVLHSGTDDLGLGGDDGSLATGNAGSRLGCCAIVDTTGTGDNGASGVGTSLSMIAISVIFNAVKII